MQTKTKSKIASVIYVLFAIVFIGVRITNIQPLVGNFLTALIGLLALGYYFLKKGLNKINLYIVLLGAVLTIGMMFAISYNGNADFLDLLWIWSYIGIAVLIYEFNISKKIFWGVAYIFLLVVLVFMFQGNAASEFLKVGSENNISAYTIFFVLLGYLAEDNNKGMRYIPAFLTLAISLWTGSRAGILSAGVLIGCIFINNLFVVKKRRFSTFIKISFFVFAGLWAANHFFGDYMLQFFEKINRYGNTSVRTEIWLEYIRGVFGSFGNFLFGVNMTGANYPLLNYYSGNIHNSFLMVHAKYGIIGALTVFMFMGRSTWKALRCKNALLVIVILVASVRMFFDWIAFPGLYDVIFWLLVIYAIDKGNKNEKCDEKA